MQICLSSVSRCCLSCIYSQSLLTAARNENSVKSLFFNSLFTTRFAKDEYLYLRSRRIPIGQADKVERHTPQSVSPTLITLFMQTFLVFFSAKSLLGINSHFSMYDVCSLFLTLPHPIANWQLANSHNSEQANGIKFVNDYCTDLNIKASVPARQHGVRYPADVLTLMTKRPPSRHCRAPFTLNDKKSTHNFITSHTY